MPPIGEAHVLIMATNRFEESELFGPREILLGKGAKVTVASLSLDEILGTVHDEPGKTIKPDVLIKDVTAADYDALLLPGGVGNPDKLRMHEDAIGLIREFANTEKPVAAICHGPWLLVEADLLRGRKATSWPGCTPFGASVNWPGKTKSMGSHFCLCYVTRTRRSVRRRPSG